MLFSVWGGVRNGSQSGLVTLGKDRRERETDPIPGPIWAQPIHTPGQEYVGTNQTKWSGNPLGVWAHREIRTDER